MAEWLNAPVLKTDVGESLPWVRIPPPPQKQWSQIERGVKALMKEHGPDIPLESLKAMKHTYDNYHSEKDVALEWATNNNRS